MKFFFFFCGNWWGKAIPRSRSREQETELQEEKGRKAWRLPYVQCHPMVFHRRKLLRVQGNHLLWGWLNLFPCRSMVKEET